MFGADDLAVGAFGRELALAAAFPKADTAFPKTRNAERQAAETGVAVFRADV